MLHLCRFVPGLDYRLTLDPGGSVSLIGENGVDILFYAQYRADHGTIVLNSAIDRNWEAEVALPVHDAAEPATGSAPKPCPLSLRFAGSAMEITIGTAQHGFARFDARRCAAVAFVRLHWARDPDDALIWRGETLETALAGIEAHLLHRRMDDLERRMGRPDAR